MKTILTAIIVVLVVTAAFAGQTEVKFTSPTVVNGTKIAPGEYIVKYDIKGNTADIKVIRDQKTVATTTGTVVEMNEKAPYDGIVRENNGDGSASLKEIQIANKKQVIKIDGNASAVGK